jgi:hypothetical protein
VVTNPYPFAMNLWHAQAYAALFNSAGKIIGGGQSVALTDGISTPTKVKPGKHVQVSIDVAAPMARVVRAQVSATP